MIIPAIFFFFFSNAYPTAKHIGELWPGQRELKCRHGKPRTEQEAPWWGGLRVVQGELSVCWKALMDKDTVSDCGNKDPRWESWELEVSIFSAECPAGPPPCSPALRGGAAALDSSPSLVSHDAHQLHWGRPGSERCLPKTWCLPRDLVEGVSLLSERCGLSRSFATSLRRACEFLRWRANSSGRCQEEWFPKYPSSTVSLAWELVWPARSQTPSQTQWVTNGEAAQSVLTSLPGDSDVQLRTTDCYREAWAGHRHSAASPPHLTRHGPPQRGGAPEPHTLLFSQGSLNHWSVRTSPPAVASASSAQVGGLPLPSRLWYRRPDSSLLTGRWVPCTGRASC